MSDKKCTCTSSRTCVNCLFPSPKPEETPGAFGPGWIWNPAVFGDSQRKGK